jgi:hypothetical protein
MSQTGVWGVARRWQARRNVSFCRGAKVMADCRRRGSKLARGMSGDVVQAETVV